MKKLILLSSVFLSIVAQAQADTVRKIEPNRETSFDNYELLVIALVALAVLMALFFWYRKSRKR